ncbi:hypothetical protein GCM10023213_13920 [Prosthecobacter algae]|uniref:Uncharacterized protein n=1 Tax=Prosthecobacter algae TaxID=1144682 RepID=A0ABP9NZF5_9BACT
MKTLFFFLLFAIAALGAEMRTFGRLDTQELVTLPVDEKGVPDLEPLRIPQLSVWVPPAVVPLVKIPAPEINVTTQRAEPTLVWFADRVERQWIIRDIKPLESAKATLQAGYLVQPEGFTLSLADRDRLQFTQMLALVREALDLGLISNTTPQKIADSEGNLHEISTLRFRQIMVGYGFCYKTAWDQAKASE